MNKEWFIWLQGKQEGPYSIVDLKADSRLSPDTLVWKEGFKTWVPIRRVPELKDIFKDQRKKPQPIQGEFNSKPLFSEDEAISIQQDPFQFYLWVLVIILIIIYLFFYLQDT